MEDPVFVGSLKGTKPIGLIPTGVNKLSIKWNIIRPIESNAGDFTQLGLATNNGVSTGVVAFIKFGDGNFSRKRVSFQISSYLLLRVIIFKQDVIG